MPYYDFKCTQCRRKFTVKQTFDEHDCRRNARNAAPRRSSVSLAQ
jgi:putative FmdB family regulatory protein